VTFVGSLEEIGDLSGIIFLLSVFFLRHHFFFFFAFKIFSMFGFQKFDCNVPNKIGFISYLSLKKFIRIYSLYRGDSL
jgi:hypothetical protein